MDIPESCQAWASAMESGGEGPRRILANVREDPCVPDPVASMFLERLSSPGPPSSADEAKRHAYNVVRADRDTFLCRGREVPDNLFERLFRIEEVDNLRWRVPGYLVALGVTASELDELGSIEDEDLLTLTDEYEGPVDLGNSLGIVWVADYEEVEPMTNDLETLSDLLGRQAVEGSGRFVICMYNRGDPGRSLHVPRCLDGIDQEQFQVTADCEADHGMTRPISGISEDGLPEAVHRSCSVTPALWELRTIT